MFENIIKYNLYGEILIAFLIFAYIFLRFSQKRLQKLENWNNFEFWIYFNLIDFYKFNGYPYPQREAKKTLNNIIKIKNNDCNLINNEKI